MSARLFALLWLACSLGGCAVSPPVPPDGGAHLAASAAEPAPPPAAPAAPIPVPRVEPRYTVVVNNAPLRELLLTLARDAQLDLELHEGVAGRITLNAVDQPLPQILARIARSNDIRFELSGAQLMVRPDTPYLRTYRIDYVNIARKTAAQVNVATEIATTGGAATGTPNRAGSNNSTTILSQESANQFWETLLANVSGILGGGDQSRAILLNRESGLLTVRATDRRHSEIRELIEQILPRAQQQVLIEATVVEVELSDRFQGGVDWSLIDPDNGLAATQNLIGTNLAAAPVATFTLDKPASHLSATVRMLEQFGSLKVLSSPKVMALNNQTAMLKVVDNRIYFTVDVDVQAATSNSPVVTTYETHVHTVPVGFIMAVTPQISDSEVVTLNVRPTISRILDFVQDPNPALAQAGVVSEIPEIQVREIESVLKVPSGRIAVLGGLMQDAVDAQRRGVPGLSRLPLVGGLFTFRDDRTRKTELVIFLRPTVVRSVETAPVTPQQGGT